MGGAKDNPFGEGTAEWWVACVAKGRGAVLIVASAPAARGDRARVTIHVRIREVLGQASGIRTFDSTHWGGDKTQSQAPLGSTPSAREMVHNFSSTQHLQAVPFVCLLLVCGVYSGASLIRNRFLLGPYSRTIPMTLRRSWLFLMSEEPLYRFYSKASSHAARRPRNALRAVLGLRAVWDQPSPISHGEFYNFFHLLFPWFRGRGNAAARETGLQVYLIYKRTDLPRTLP